MASGVVHQFFTDPRRLRSARTRRRGLARAGAGPADGAADACALVPIDGEVPQIPLPPVPARREAGVLRLALLALARELLLPSRRRRPDLRVARRQRHAGAVGPGARHADQDLRGARRAGLPHHHGPGGHGGSAPRFDGFVRRARAAPFAASRAGAGRHPGGVGLQPARHVAQGRDGPDAADAGHGARARRPQPLRPGGEHSRRHGVPAAAARQVRRQRGAGARRLQRRLRRRGPLRPGCRRTARRATTSARSA